MHPQVEKIKKAYENFLDEKLAHINRQYKLGLLLATLIVPTVLVFFFLLRPMGEEIDKLAKDNQYLKGEIQKVEALAGKLDEHKAEKAEVELRLKAASLLLPRQKEIPRLLTSISEQGTSSGLDFVSFYPRGEQPSQFYSIIPVSITVLGSYHKIGTFLDRISKLNRIVTVNSLSLGGAQLVDNEMRLSASLELTTYRFQDSAN
ncbi:MAG: type 4a pilus biogenesis protein PilO [Proteobacteria bacterium]|nr:type 4a pilus biogenesis protein PilO [Pseudomonadota bacterium]MBU1687546.1 type 4a pilus biogenesis protein PilO [Pseudomonadota bacterium]